MTSMLASVPRERVIDGALIALAAADAAVSILGSATDSPAWIWAAVVAIACLGFRNRAPRLVFALTVPATAIGAGVLASLVALCSVAERRPARGWLIVCAVTVFVCNTAPWAQEESYWSLGTAWAALYALIFAVAPVFLGLLMRARTELSSKLAEIERAHQLEEELLVERALARERADLAREMHDVVSHQVSLIAVQSGALQVTAHDDATMETAQTIRALSVQTLDELREMVGVLRAPSGGPTTELAPQPGFDDVAALVAASGVPAVLSTHTSTSITPSAAVQRGIYRAVQEGLTNVTKHAPGATATVELQIDRRHVRLELTNSKPCRTPDQLPSAQHGLLGLRERAELLGGTLQTGHLSDGGYRLSMTLPTHG